jgi:hypothetical protein
MKLSQYVAAALAALAALAAAESSLVKSPEFDKEKTDNFSTTELLALGGKKQGIEEKSPKGLDRKGIEEKSPKGLDSKLNHPTSREQELAVTMEQSNHSRREQELVAAMEQGAFFLLFPYFFTLCW